MVKVVFQKFDISSNIENFIFDCGKKEFNKFFFRESRDFLLENYSQIYYFKKKRSSQIIGYLTLSCCSVKHKKGLSIKKIARHIPGILLGKLAIDSNFQEQKFGTDLTKKAIGIALEISKDIGCRCVFADATTELKVIEFYLTIGFKFFDLPMGRKIVITLQNDLKPERDTIKMYFDLKKIRK